MAATRSLGAVRRGTKIPASLLLIILSFSQSSLAEDLSSANSVTGEAVKTAVVCRFCPNCHHHCLTTHLSQITTPLPTTTTTTSSSTSTPKIALSTPLIIGITLASTLVFLLLLSLLIFLLRRRRRSKPNLKPTQSNHELLNHHHHHHQSSTTLVTTLPPRARTPIPFAKPFAHLKKASQDILHAGASRITPLSGLDTLREREGLGTLGYGRNTSTRGGDSKTTESVVDSLDWDWKRVYVYPFEGGRAESRASSRLGSETTCTFERAQER
ncbi:hypothetical protein QBC44DRAFT_327318 [Cladorrhinum sp. PSN332]|nr:hypothetical protein QBC44DRAFT_327318 [Cladorrhinum sp. PSN332]